MRVVMVSKALVVGAYQRKLEEIARLPGVELTAIVPAEWRDRRGRVTLERAHVTGYELIAAPLRFNGQYHLHFYPTLGRLLQQLRPDILHMDEEPYNLATWHALWHARRYGAHTLFYSWQNIARSYPLPVRAAAQWVLRRADYAFVGTQSAAEVWRANPEFKDRGTWVFEWRRAKPDLSDDYLIVHDIPGAAETFAAKFPERPVFRMILTPEAPYWNVVPAGR